MEADATRILVPRTPKHFKNLRLCAMSFIVGSQLSRSRGSCRVVQELVPRKTVLVIILNLQEADSTRNDMILSPKGLGTTRQDATRRFSPCANRPGSDLETESQQAEDTILASPMVVEYVRNGASRI